MAGKWGVFFQGRIAAVKVTRKGAEALAFEAMKVKGWKQEDVEVKQLQTVEVK